MISLVCGSRIIELEPVLIALVGGSDSVEFFWCPRTRNSLVPEILPVSSTRK